MSMFMLLLENLCKHYLYYNLALQLLHSTSIVTSFICGFEILSRCQNMRVYIMMAQNKHHCNMQFISVQWLVKRTSIAARYCYH